MLCAVERAFPPFGIARIGVVVIFGAEQPHERWTSKRVCYINDIVRSVDGAIIKSQMPIDRSWERAEMGDMLVFGAVRHGVIEEALEKRIHRRLVYNCTVKFFFAIQFLYSMCALLWW